MLTWSVLFVLVVTVVSHVLGATVLRSTMWGVHFLGFFSRPVLAGSTFAVVAGAVALFRWRPLRDRLDSWGAAGRAALDWRSPLGLMLASLVVLWLGRASHTYLGDGTSLSTDIPAGTSFHPRQPLTMLLQRQIYELLGGWFGRGSRPDVLVAEDALAWGSVLAGAVFAGVVWLLAGQLAGPRSGLVNRRHQLVLALILSSQGYVQLFFGYVENYAFVTVCLAAYLWSALRVLRGAGTILVPGVILLLGVALHLSAAVMVPSFVVLAGWSMASPSRRPRASFDVVVLGILTATMQLIFRAVGDGYDLLGSVVSVGAMAVTGQQEHGAGYLLSGVHVRDFFNEQMLIGPMGLFLVMPVAVTTSWRRLRADPSLSFLGLAALGVIVTSWFAQDSNLGYARNWDLLAPGGMVLTVAGLGFLLRTTSEARPLLPALAVALLVSAYHTAPWIATNASFDRSFERLKMLPLGKGRTEMLVGKWYIRQNDLDEAESWLVEATRVNPNNNNAHYILGMLHLQQGRPETAAVALSRAVALRPDKVDMRIKLVEALMTLDRRREAVPHLKMLAEKAPTVQRWMEYGNVLRSIGRTEDAREAFEEAVTLHGVAMAADPDGFETNLQHGILLANLNELQTALPYLRRALMSNPTSDAALFYTGYTLLLLDQGDEARALLRRCLEVNPRHPNRADIERWIGRDGVPFRER